MPILKIQGPILPEMIPDSTLAIRFPVPTTIWCELADGISGLVGRNSPARRTVSLMRWRAVLLARPLAHTPYFAVARWCVSPYLFFALQTQKIPERAAGGLVWVCGRSRRGCGVIWLVEATPRGRFGKN